jgi:hypothetical protein
VADDERRVVEPPPADEAVAPTLYLGMAGTGVPVRKQEFLDCAGKQPDGSAKTREVKLCTVWSADGRDEEGTPVGDQGSISYSAAIERTLRGLLGAPRSAERGLTAPHLTILTCTRRRVRGPTAVAVDSARPRAGARPVVPGHRVVVERRVAVS